MRSKADILNRQLRPNFPLIITHTNNLAIQFQITRNTAISTIASNNHPILLIVTPFLQQGPRLPVLEHARGAHDDHRVVLFLVDFLLAAQIVDVLVVEWVYRLLVKFLLDFLA